MAKKKKHQFHCEKCSSPCEIYKKGKNHRVLVCPRCGVIATNPLPLALAGAILPSLIQAGGEVLQKKEKPQSEKPRKTLIDSLDKPNKAERYVKLALEG